jgi:RHH-type rel operon transcriptional repressor/antitoxin RelB
LQKRDGAFPCGGMIALELPELAEKAVVEFAKKSRVSPATWARRRFLELLEDLEDVRIAEERLAALRRGESRLYTPEEVKRELGIQI